MEETMIDISLSTPTETVLEAIEQSGYVFKGTFCYDYHELGHKWYERIKTELFEKDNKLFYFAGVLHWQGEKISVIRIGEIENKSSKNPECIFT